uniref:Uncharacterized protein n=1 Tax=Canis lupus familiaris TaxID=9615 RepID=A0A8C0QAD7_CANLF
MTDVCVCVCPKTHTHTHTHTHAVNPPGPRSQAVRAKHLSCPESQSRAAVQRISSSGSCWNFQQPLPGASAPGSSRSLLQAPGPGQLSAPGTCIWTARRWCPGSRPPPPPRGRGPLRVAGRGGTHPPAGSPAPRRGSGPRAARRTLPRGRGCARLARSSAAPTSAPPPPRAYHEHGDPGGQRVEERGGHGAAVLRARVGLAVGAVVAEEALHVHAERVGVLEVVRQHHRPCHDHHLEIEHAAAERRGPPRGPPAGAAGPPPGAAGRRGAAAGRGGGSAGSPGAGGLRRRRPSPGRAPAPLPAPARRPPPAASAARPAAGSRGRAGSPPEAGGGRSAPRAAERAASVGAAAARAQPPGRPGGGGVGGRGGTSRAGGTCAPRRAGAAELPALLAEGKAEHGGRGRGEGRGGEAAEKELLETPFRGSSGAEQEPADAGADDKEVECYAPRIATNQLLTSNGVQHQMR